MGGRGYRGKVNMDVVGLCKSVFYGEFYRKTKGLILYLHLEDFICFAIICSKLGPFL